ncbi:hypothetical protein DK419_25705 [Methylobacterium terrae]|uniref:Uncharacterized protein n=1 Tax=Methylobacterium terrae TaxID=2202827 RepID=A0A2U8WSP9_9HYPH|nr:hypothetical protein [Methylobacterium terrae]AWN49324.1 hypothetical protein DK419_25705 [Methylobacterium terrae]
MRAACRLCGFPVRGFLNGTTCVLQVDGRALRDSCREAAGACREAAGACREAAGDCRDQHACAGLQEAVRAARKT